MSAFRKYDDSSAIMQGGDAEQAADFANYFCSYAYLYHQKQMLMDHNRMRAYRNAILQNKHLFEGKVVLDVGTGSGVLAIWCAQAGAAKVFACEYTDMANHARSLIAHNGLSHVIEVVQSSAEELNLPCQVDVIVSEWMGYFLLRESMLDSVIRARNKWLRPGGCMFPSHATMYWAPISYEEDREGKMEEYAASINDWKRFLHDMKQYNIDMSVLSPPYEKEQSDYYVYSALWTELRPEHLIGDAIVLRQFDLTTCTLEEVEKIPPTNFSMRIPYPATISGFAGWFTVDFLGSPENPVVTPVQLTTGPEGGYTHWGQQVFYFLHALNVEQDDQIDGCMEMVRQQKNQRLYNIRMEYAVNGQHRTSGIYELP